MIIFLASSALQAGSEKSSHPSNAVILGERIFFVATDGSDDRELWISDGTREGTRQVKNINPKESSISKSKVFGKLTPCHQKKVIYFNADDGVHGHELWRSDGTEKGTFMVKDIRPGKPSGLKADSSDYSKIVSRIESMNFTIAPDGLLYFKADDGVHGTELWKTDGTEKGTVMVKDIRPGKYSGLDKTYTMDPIITPNGILFFQAENDVNGRELWKTDGTEKGTVMIKDIRPGEYSGFAAFSSMELVISPKGLLYFKADDGIHGKELWKSDGTEKGTVMVKDIASGKRGGLFSSTTSEFTFGTDGTLFFRANDGINGLEAWKSDGTEKGTVRIRDINPGPKSGLSEFADMPFTITTDGVLYFGANDGIHGNELWQSDGTLYRTVMVVDTSSGPGNPGPTALVDLGGIRIFSTKGTDLELWRTDTTQKGTYLLHEKIKHFLGRAGNNAFFTQKGNLWKTDGTREGTVMVKDINPTATITVSSMLARGDKLFFYLDDGIHEEEPWVTDGTDKGTFMLKDINPNL